MDELSVVIRASAENISEVVNETVEGIQTIADKAKKPIGFKVDPEPLKQSSEQAKKSAEETKRSSEEASKAVQASAAEQAAAWGALSAVVVKVFAKIVSAIQTGIDASNQYKAAMIGLESVASSKGIGSDATEAEMAKVVDAFFDATSAATAFKNLFSRGYSLDQATDTIIRLKDSAAFGRQANLGLADAVVSATEGLKNENSILVDNAGVTKNVAKMWADYAKQRKISTADMTNEMKVEAEYLGIMQETTAQVGDLAKMSDTLAGSQAEAANQSTLMAQSFGEAMTPLVSIGTEAFTGMLTGITGVSEAFPALTAGATGAALAMTALVAAMALKNTVTSILPQIGLLKNALKPLAGIAVGLGIVAGVYTHLQGKRAAEIEQLKEERAEREQNVENIKDQRTAFETLVAEYRVLSKKTDLTMGESRRLAEIQDTLRTQYGATASTLSDLSGGYDDVTRAIREMREEQAKEAAPSYSDVARDKKQEAAEELTALYNLRKDAEDLRDTLDPSDTVAIKQYTEDIAEYNQKLSESTAGTAAFVAVIDEVAARAEINGKTIDQTLLSALREMAQIDPSQFKALNTVDDEAGMFAFIDQLANTLVGNIAEIGELEELREFRATLAAGMIPSEDDFIAAQANMETLTGLVVDSLNEMGEEVTAQSDVVQNIVAALAPPELMVGSWADFGTMMMGDVHSALDAVSESLDDVDKQLKNAANLKQQNKSWKDAVKQYNAAAKSGKGAGVWMRELGKIAKDTGIKFNGTAEGIKAATKQFDEMGATADEEMAVIGSALGTLKLELATAQAEMYLRGGASLDISAAEARIAELMQKIADLEAFASAKGFSLDDVGATTKSGGGGGGGGKDSEEEAAKEAERLRKEAIQRDYDMIAHKRHMNEITLEQELTMLERIRRAHQLNAEEIMDWEEKIYDLKKEIRERDAGSVDQLGDGIIDALSARYEAMLEAETERLDASREGWEKWRDDSVKAIEDQIAALDKLADTEDREAKDAEELRKIEKLRRSIEYEQDDYNRMKLQEQLEKAIADRADRLRKLDLQDQKEALREEIEGINSKADEQITALDKEQEAIEKSYEERLKSAALQAEAERLVMQSSQEELVELLGEFAPEYDALGKTFGEKLVEGFQSRVGNIVSWFEDFNANLYEIQQNAASTALAGADAFYAAQQQRSAETNSATAAPTVVYQTVQFNEPVESPSRVARRIEEANEALGAMLV